jgi:uncharacterized protein YciI
MPLYVRTLLVTGPAEEVSQASEGHRAHLRRLKDEGRLRAAGAFASDDGYLEIFEAKDRLDAESIARSSPLVEQGLGAWMVREWEELDL